MTERRKWEGFLTPEGEAHARADLDARNAQVHAAIEQCPHCKRAKNRTAKGNDPRNRTECSRHREALRLNYVTSPLSETYWAS